MARRRLDAELVRRGLASSRIEAQVAVRAGRVMVGGSLATKATALVAPEQALHVTGPIREFVSRGGVKLRAALDRFGIEPAGRECLDAGASTGGFTDCLLRAGASRVASVDVGYGQLAWQLRNDPRVVVLERTNVKDLTSDLLGFVPSLVVADLSFVSLRAALPAILSIAAAGADLVVLIKPQFEAERNDVARGGVVRDAAVWRRVLEEVSGAFGAAGAAPRGLMASPLLGPAGNVEFLLHAERGAAPATLGLDEAIAEAEQVRGS